MTSVDMVVTRVLVEARALIADPACWIRGRLRDYDRQGVPCCWCAVGAIDHVATNGYEDAGARNALQLEVPVGTTIAMFNDSVGHGDVMLAFDRAIAKTTESAS